MTTTQLPIDNSHLDALLERRGAPRGRKSEEVTPRLLNVLNVLHTRQGSMRCGKLYARCPQTGVYVSMASDTDDIVARLYRRGLIEKRGDRLLPTPAGFEALAKMSKK